MESAEQSYIITPMLRIAKIEISSGLILAPMAGITDLAYRTMAREFGCEFAFLEMLNARSMSQKNRKAKELLKSNDFDKPLGAQLLGADIDYLLKSANALQSKGISLLDFNAACPVRKVVKRNEGAALMRAPKKLSAILKALVDNLNIPVTLKMRSGWDKESINAVEIAKVAQEAGVSAIFIHGRHRAQGYSGNVSYKIIREVKNNVTIPVIASGDILSPLLAKRMFEETQCDGILVARGSIGRPWIFQEIKKFFKEGVLSEPLDFSAIKEIILRHVRLSIEEYGEKVALIKMRRLLPFYVKNISGCRKFRARINEIKCAADLKALLEGFI